MTNLLLGKDGQVYRGRVRPVSFMFCAHFFYITFCIWNEQLVNKSFIVEPL